MAIRDERLRIERQDLVYYGVNFQEAPVDPDGNFTVTIQGNEFTHRSGMLQVLDRTETKPLVTIDYLLQSRLKAGRPHTEDFAAIMVGTNFDTIHQGMFPQIFVDAFVFDGITAADYPGPDLQPGAQLSRALIQAMQSGEYGKHLKALREDSYIEQLIKNYCWRNNRRQTFGLEKPLPNLYGDKKPALRKKMNDWVREVTVKKIPLPSQCPNHWFAAVYDRIHVRILPREQALHFISAASGDVEGYVHSQRDRSWYPLHEDSNAGVDRIRSLWGIPLDKCLRDKPGMIYDVVGPRSHALPGPRPMTVTVGSEEGETQFKLYSDGKNKPEGEDDTTELRLTITPHFR